MKSRIFTLLTLFVTIISNAQLPVAGNLDTNFGTSGSVFPPAQKGLIPYNINVQPQTGEIVTVGYYKNSSGKTVGFIGRYDFYGNPKANFGTNGVIEISNLSSESQVVYRAYFESSDLNSAIYIRGIFKNGTISSQYISKFLSNGTLDTSYGTNGSIIDIKGQIHGNYIYSLDLNITTQHQSFKRYHLTDGTLDLTFNNGDLPFLNSETSFNFSQYDNLNIQSDGRIVLCGHSGSVAIIARYDSTGHLDTDFGTNGYYKTDEISLVADAFYTKTQSDGKIIFLNDHYYTGISSPVLGRLNSNGTLDTTYGTAGYFKYNFEFTGTYIDAIEIQSDDKILFCGSIGVNNNNSVLFTARVSNTGALDFWRNDLESTYSENWSLALIKDTYALTFGNSTSDDYTRTFPVIQKLYLKSPLISLNGSSLPNGTADLDLTTSDGVFFSTENAILSTGEVKFRLDHSESCYWGAGLLNPYPSGISTMGAETITINTAGTYKVTFDIKTGAYSFTNTTLGTIEHDSQKEKFTFYPNPTKEKLTFSENLKSIKVYTSDGKLMNSNLINNEINISSFSKGVYYFQALTENNSIIGNKFIKE